MSHCGKCSVPVSAQTTNFLSAHRCHAPAVLLPCIPQSTCALHPVPETPDGICFVMCPSPLCNRRGPRPWASARNEGAPGDRTIAEDKLGRLRKAVCKARLCTVVPLATAIAGALSRIRLVERSGSNRRWIGRNPPTSREELMPHVASDHASVRHHWAANKAAHFNSTEGRRIGVS
ncbi:hypothetical protein VTK56DRAFT_1170 [Thermocarpiscus australiensis]